MKKPELMAPAGDWTMLRAVVKAGANAVYFGTDQLNMRAKAKNFQIENLPEIVKFCKSHNVKTYLTINTIIYENEVDQAFELIAKAKSAGIDMIICWDLSIIELCNKLNMPFAVSTQASISNSVSAEMYKKLGAKRIVLARECHLDDVKKIKAKKTRLIAFQGEPGAYSELAAFEYFAERVNSLPCQTFEDVFQSVVSGKSSHGLIPVENSLAGSIHRNFDLMLRHNLHIVGEYHLRVIHCLMALPGTNLGEIQRVFSHPQALAQCEGNLMRMGVLQEAKADTAGSARLIREKGDKTTGALASKRAAEVYGLDILVPGYLE